MREFIDQFENMAAYYTIPSDIDIEEGRLFGHDVKTKFFKLFREQSRDLFIQEVEKAPKDESEKEEKLLDGKS
jgi:hypothetical protein